MGYVRARGDTSFDQLIEISGAFIGSVVSGPDNQTSVDFNLIPSGESPTMDQLTSSLSGAVDTINYVNHGFRIIGTLDGLTMFTEATRRWFNSTKQAVISLAMLWAFGIS